MDDTIPNSLALIPSTPRMTRFVFLPNFTDNQQTKLSIYFGKKISNKSMFKYSLNKNKLYILTYYNIYQLDSQH